MMNYLECFERSKISDFRYNPEFSFRYDINPEMWWRPYTGSKYNMRPSTFLFRFLTLDSLEKIGANGVFSVAHALDSMQGCRWREAIKRNFWQSKKVLNVNGMIFDSLCELGIPQDVAGHDKMRIWQFDPEAGEIDAKGLNVVGIIYDSEFYPIWWDPFHCLFENKLL